MIIRLCIAIAFLLSIILITLEILALFANRRLDKAEAIVLDLLTDGEDTGRNLRRKVRERGVWLSRVGFYVLMANLEDARKVRSWRRQKTIDGQTVWEHVYAVAMTQEQARS
jgi:hypothetical protein